jgi:ATP-binding cassette subfamily F protein 3
MKLLAGELAGLSGTRTEARDLALGYFAQHQLEQLAVDDSPLGNLKRLGGGLAMRATEQELRDFLAGFGFTGERVFEPVAPFSGGEKARLMLAIVTFRRPNLLLLDEPTNHLDLEMRQALAVALQDYAGAVVLVSHDRHLLRTVADQFYVVHAGRVQPFDGDLEDYAQWLAQASGAGDASQSGAEPRGDSAEVRRQRRREDAQRRAALSPLKAQLAKLESQLDSLARETQQVQIALAAPDIYTDAAKSRLRELLEKQTQLARDTGRVETAWLTGSEQLEALQQSLAETGN